MFVGILAIVLLVCLWWVGDQEFRTKAIFTVIYFALWGLLFLGESGVWFTYAAMSLWSVVVGYSTFGKNFRKF
jgi:hypothetical protein